jgi:hypothetical protein
MYIPHVPEISKHLLIKVAWCSGNAIKLRLGEAILITVMYVIGEHCRGFSGISQTPLSNTRVLPRLDRYRFLSNPFEFIILRKF